MKNILLLNTRGISVLFLVIAMLLMVTLGYVLSYLIPTKQKSVSFAIYSNQTFFLSQSGVEYAVRYAADQGWATPASLLGLNAPGVNQRNLGRGQFTISYDNLTDTLTSIGLILNGSERRILVSNFTSFVSAGLILSSPPPCWAAPRTEARFYVQNVRSSSITLTAFSVSWAEPPVRSLTGLLMGGVQKFGGTYNSGSGMRNFTPPGTTQIVNPSQTLMVNLVWDKNITPNCSVTISFYDSSGNQYTLNLDPEGDGFPNC